MKKFLLVIIFLSLFMIPVYAEEQPIPIANLEDISEPGKYTITLYYQDHNGLIYKDTVVLEITEDALGESELEDIVEDTVGSDFKIIGQELPETGQEIPKSQVERIFARNITVQVGVMDSISDRDLIQIAEVHAYNETTNQPVPITMVFRDKKTPTQYEITFATELRTSKAIIATETKAPETVAWEDPKVVHKVFTEINAFTIAGSFVAMLVVPVMFISIVYVYVNKKIRDAEAILYQEKDR